MKYDKLSYNQQKSFIYKFQAFLLKLREAETYPNQSLAAVRASTTGMELAS